MSPRVRSLGVALLLALAIACGDKSPIAPTTTTTTTIPVVATRIISVSGDLTFGTVNFGASSDRTFTIANSGNSTLTVSAITTSGGTGSAGFTASVTSGAIAAGASQLVIIHFAPTIAQFYTTNIVVVSDQTSGTSTIPASGTGFNNTPLFTMNGVGNNVVNVPASVTKLRIIGTYTASSSNFVVWIGPAGSACGVVANSNCHLLVNELLGTSWGQTVFDGVQQTGGGTVLSVQFSSGVSWSITEVR